MQVVSGAIGKERIHYEAPAAEKIPLEVDRFISWFNSSDLEPVLRGAIAHFWFVTLHPFEDGNGRIGRAISEKVLAQGDI